MGTPETEALLVGPEPTTSLEVVDLAHLRDFLVVLQSSGVASFSGFGVHLTFNRQDSYAVPIPGFSAQAQGAGAGNQEPASIPSVPSVVGRDGWRHPSLWPASAGRILKLDGSLE